MAGQMIENEGLGELPSVSVQKCFDCCTTYSEQLPFNLYKYEEG